MTWGQAMFEKISRSWELAKASASVLNSDRELLVFPVVSAICVLVVLATFMIPAVAFKLFADGYSAGSLAFAFAFYFCQYFVIIFCNCALVSAAMIRLEGGNPTVADGFNAARSRMGAIAGYAAIAATVGMILKALKDRDNNFIVRLIGGALGAAWTMATFLVVPVLVAENVGPMDALKRSVAMFKRTWGESAAGMAGIGLACFVAMLALGAAGFGLAYVLSLVSSALAVLIGAVTVLALLALAVYQSALGSVYSAALYRYAVDGEVPRGFEGLALEAPRR
ncbi:MULTISPECIES: DUF6159 family protein [Lysobacter]|uniref:DUF6159 family protein n=1 Tax=Lysobacter TaxID=68 RepID=UPI001F237CFF|nr:MULTISPECIES: DUF6159 family protein [Lysobacter]UJB18596.1 DUF6159 family protein [Lysobacter capsici]UJQ27679.1 DUF6159 family protein [Lysobacter gummosus]